MKKLASLGSGGPGGVAGGVAGLAVVALLASWGQAADSAPALVANPMADVTDLYAWMSGTNLNLIMDVSPKDNGANSFGPAVLYVFHLTSKSGRGVDTTGGTETKVICRFASNTSVECWVVTGATTKDYVTGDPSNTAGAPSLLGKVKVFAGRRSDPSFFNQTGFSAAVTTLSTLRTPADVAGCPTGITTGQASTLRNTTLITGPDEFAASNVMAIVVQVDKSLVNTSGNSAVAVWASTHAGS